MMKQFSDKSKGSEKKSNNSPSEHEQIIKEKLESWIADVQKNTDLEQRLKKAFESDTSHTKSLSQL